MAFQKDSLTLTLLLWMWMRVMEVLMPMMKTWFWRVRPPTLRQSPLNLSQESLPPPPSSTVTAPVTRLSRRRLSQTPPESLQAPASLKYLRNPLQERSLFMKTQLQLLGTTLIRLHLTPSQHQGSRL